MKNVAVSNKTMQKLKQIKKEKNLKHHNATICWLLKKVSLLEEKTHIINDTVSVEKHSGFLQEKPDIMDIRMHVDALTKAKNLEENVEKNEASNNLSALDKSKTSSVFELRCLQCDNIPFKISESVFDETGVTCPHCGYCTHDITLVFIDDAEILI